MYFDALTVAAVAAELGAELLEGRVQRVLLPESLSVALEVYARRKRRYLIASAHAQRARVHLASDRPRRGVESAPPLLLLLRKYVRGARLAEVRQPPSERILHLVFDGPHGPVKLIIEAIGRYSNLVLVGEDGTVMDAIKRVGPELNRYRVMLPNHAYVPPPSQDKLLLADVTEYRLRGLLAEWPLDTPLRKVLVGGIAGISPLASAEIVFRALGDMDAPVEMVRRMTPLLQAFRALTLKPSQPSIVCDEEEVVAYAPYALTHMENWEPVQSISAAVVAYYDKETDSYRSAKAPLLKAIDNGRGRLARRREKLMEEQEVAGDPDSLKRMGEAILAHAHQIERGQSELVVEWVPGNGPLRVQLNPRLSPSENAQIYFRRYRKAQRRVIGIPARLAQVASEEAYLDQLAQDLTMAENRPEIDAVAAVLVEAGYMKHERKRPPGRTRGPLRFESPDGLSVWVGKNSRQNEEVTFRRASSEDLWLHARGVPGAHVIVQSDGRRIPEQTVKWAAALAAHYSRGRDNTQVAVDVVERRHVRRLKGGRPGQVVYRNERTLWIRPQAPPDPPRAGLAVQEH